MTDTSDTEHSDIEHSDIEHLPADDASAVTGYYEGQKEALTRPPVSPISLEILDGADDHFLLVFDRPGRVEIGLIANDNGTRVLAHVYDGSKINLDQAPLFAYDGTQDTNHDVSR